MKTLFAMILALVASLAQAGTLELPEPTVVQLNPGAACAGSQTPNDTATTYTRQGITGWSADGTKVFAKTYGSYPCGNPAGGRGTHYWAWCGTFTWTLTFDPEGNLNPVGTAVYTPISPIGAQPTSAQLAQCYDENPGAVFYNSFNYGATVKSEPLIYGYYKGVATLLIP